MGKMNQLTNIPNAAVIIASLYFITQAEYYWWIGTLIFLTFFLSIATWQIWTGGDISKDLIKVQINEIKVKTAESLARTLNSAEHTKFLYHQRLNYERQMKK